MKRSLFGSIALGMALSAAVPLPRAMAAVATPRAPEIAGVDLHLDMDSTAFDGGANILAAWVERAGGIVANYYGRFPTRALRIEIQPINGDGVRGGQTFGSHGGFIRLRVGRGVTDAQLHDDWVLVHEMTHLALPEVGGEHAWLSEGLATYIEGVARVQAGNRAQSDVWQEEMRSMPRGLPQPGDRGLDHTHTWGRTYWGGAMFCLLADVEIHRRTQNRLGLQDAMRAVTAASGGLSADWTIERVLRTADEAVGARVLEDLYDQMKDTPVTPDLMGLWRKLGVEPDGSSVRLKDDAPLADVRRAIMQARSPTK
jgi:hypothetical protein